MMPASVRSARVSDRKLAEMQRKLQSLDAELTDWEQRSNAKKPLEKHNTQIRRVGAVLRAARDLVDQRMANAEESASGILGDAQSIERLILELHRIWQFYRGKLALRDVEYFANYLAAADDLAWACYEPPCRAMVMARKGDERAEARTRLREPPLTFFNGGSSPFTTPRGWAYDAEHVPEEEVRTREFVALLRDLPIPVIGLPWFQLAQLPDALVIGHEVGHDVETDLALTSDIEQLIAGAVPASRRTAWQSWSGEVFADVFGVLAGGSAFAGALIDFLVTDRDFAAGELQTDGAWGLYPTTHLRVTLVIRAVRELDRVLRESEEKNSPFAGEADRLQAEWDGEYGTEHQMKSYARDAEGVVRALLATPFPSSPWGANTPLCDVLRFTSAQQARAEKIAGLVNGGYEAGDESDVRCLVAAARLAFERKPEAAQSAQKLILDRVVRARKPGVRADGVPLRTLTMGEGQARERVEQHDRQAGAALFERLQKRVGGNEALGR